MPPQTPLEIRPADDRFRTDATGRSTRHSFSFGRHYDPTNVGFASLVAHNDDRVQPGAGYDDHPHRDLEIVTWVLSGALTHRDTDGHTGVVVPGTVQAVSAGTGIVHSERVDPGAAPTRFVQTWVRPRSPGGRPSYAAAAVDLDARDTLVPIASGERGDAAVPVDAGATLYAARLTRELQLPEAAQAHVFVCGGAVLLDGQALGDGDAARISGRAAHRVSAVGGEAELLVWTFSER